MNPIRVLALAKRIVIQFRRDRRTVVLIFGIPILALWLLGLTLRYPRGAVRVGLAYHGPETIATPSGRLELKKELVLHLQKANFAVEQMDEAKLEGALRGGQLEAGLVVDGSKLLQGLREVDIQGFRVVLEGSDPTRSSTTLLGLGKVLRQVSGKAPILGNLLPTYGEGELTVEYMYGGPAYDTLDYFAPAFIGLFVFFFVLILTCIAFLRERARGTMERVMASPLTRAEVVLGYMLGFGLFATIQSAVVLLYATYGLKIRYAGSLGLVFFVEILLTIAAVNLGIFFSAYARNELQAVQFIPLVILPQIFLSGIVWRIEDMPSAFQGLARLLPLTYANRALRDVMIRGKGLLGTWPNLLALAVFAIVMVLLSAFTLRKEIA